MMPKLDVARITAIILSGRRCRFELLGVLQLVALPAVESRLLIVAVVASKRVS